MAREAAKSKALQPRGMIQSRLEKQKAKVMEPTIENKESKPTFNDKKIDNISDVPTESSAMVRENIADSSTISQEVLDNVADHDYSIESNDVPVSKRRGKGRPANGVLRTALTLRPNNETVKRLRVYAAENGYGMSDVVDVLVELFLDSESLAGQLSNLKAKRKL